MYWLWFRCCFFFLLSLLSSTHAASRVDFGHADGLKEEGLAMRPAVYLIVKHQPNWGGVITILIGEEGREFLWMHRVTVVVHSVFHVSVVDENDPMGHVGCCLYLWVLPVLPIVCHSFHVLLVVFHVRFPIEGHLTRIYMYFNKFLTATAPTLNCVPSITDR